MIPSPEGFQSRIVHVGCFFGKVIGKSEVELGEVARRSSSCQQQRGCESSPQGSRSIERRGRWKGGERGVKRGGWGEGREGRKEGKEEGKEGWEEKGKER